MPRDQRSAARWDASSFWLGWALASALCALIVTIAYAHDSKLPPKDCRQPAEASRLQN
jgi:hypothetical protein